ncbi:unnamed protein product [Effrenium voratum]|nr:unnamed protein product [Effrenium voratum]
MSWPGHGWSGWWSQWSWHCSDWSESDWQDGQKQSPQGGPLLCELGPATLRQKWVPFVQDWPRQSFALVLPRESGALPEARLAEWFHRLHPQQLGQGGWSSAHHQGQELLRKTAWLVWPPCECAYDYSDTRQEAASNPEMRAILEEITKYVAAACGVEDNPPNSVNLNFYPPGGGVGFHADDEDLFDGLRQATRIISLSLAESETLGKRFFEVRLKRGGSVKAVELRHGDLMTMEGFFQKHYVPWNALLEDRP